MGSVIIDVFRLGSRMILFVIVGLEVMIGDKVVCLKIVCPNAGMAAESIVAVSKYFFMTSPPCETRTLQIPIFKLQIVSLTFNLKYFVLLIRMKVWMENKTKGPNNPI